MPSTTDLRKTLTDPTPLYFAAGVIEKVRTEAPERLAKVRETDPKVVQDKFQERVQEALSVLDTDVKKLREQAQHFALQSVGFAAETAVKAKEGYDALAEQGKSAVEQWRSKEAGEPVTYEATIEREPVTEPEAAEPKAEELKAEEPRAEAKKAAPRKAAGAKSTAPKKTAAARKTTPKSE